MDRLHRTKDCLAEKLPASDYVWRSYLASQVRYDLILTNALVYGDDLRARLSDGGFASEAAAWPGYPGIVGWAIAPAAGRTALEGYGAYLSLYGLRGAGECLSASEAASVSPGELAVERVTRILFQLIFPASLPSDVSPGQYWRKCGAACESHWKRRYAYLRALLDVAEGGRDAACERLEKYYTPYSDGLYLHAPVGPRARQFQLNHRKFQRLCGKNR
jgi:hypothetical protein